MRCRCVPLKIALAITLTAAASAVRAADDAPPKVGLLLVAHGAPNPKWNAPVLEAGEELARRAADEGRFATARMALLEFAKPDVATAVDELQQAGCARIVAVPLFVAPSAHTLFDLPTSLGVYASPSSVRQVVAEGGRIAAPRVPIMIAPALDETNLLPEFALAEAKRLSTDAANEAIVLLAHGDAAHEPLVDRAMVRTLAYCCGGTGIQCAEFAYVEMGQGYVAAALPAIERGLQRKSRVLVIALYLNLSAQQMHATAMRQAMKIGLVHADPAEGRTVVFSDRTAIAHPTFASLVLQQATAALDAASASTLPSRAAAARATAATAR